MTPTERPVTAALLVALTLAACSPSRPDERTFGARCVSVRDGDTLEVMRGRQTLRIRLHGIDSPEKGQPFSGVARRRTAELAQGKRVRVEVRDRDAYDRLVARVYVDGQDLSTILVREGLAWRYRYYTSDPRLALLEQRARSQRRGLWQERDPVPPWEYRRARRRKTS